jgi:DMSO/TMAO reductase YedYZ molybdopterin-dependent catalytic subunit
VPRTPHLVQTGGMAQETAPDQQALSSEELGLAARNHAMPLEALRYPVTPVGLHYLLVHFDIPAVDPASYALAIHGAVERPLALTLDDLRSRHAETRALTMECAGNGRSLMSPRPLSQPWVLEAVGTGEWTGVPLAALLEEAGVRDGAVDVVFTGGDRGIDGDIEQAFQRSLTVRQAMESGALLAYDLNGAPLPPQHGFPLRMVVPGWYGMTNVKWLTSIEVVDHPFTGFYQATSYNVRRKDDDPGEPVTRIVPRSLMVPPGIPDFYTRVRVLDAGPREITGRAWSGLGAIQTVAFSDDGGTTWAPAEVEAPILGEAAWQGWRVIWNAAPGEHELCCRATDDAGNTQPLEPAWNTGGYLNNAVQRVAVRVTGA